MSGSLTHSPAQIVAQLLVDLGLGTLPSASLTWPVYDVSLPDENDEAMCVHDTQGNIDGRDMNSGTTLEHYGIMIRLRARDHLTGYAKANAVAVALDSQVANDAVTLDSSVYNVIALSRKSGPLNNGPEPGSSRVIFSANYIAAINQVT